ELAFENALFAARWLLAPFYIGLVAAMIVLLAVFLRELWTALANIALLSVEQAILKMLTLLDLALAANLVLVVILAGYENFVSKIDTAGH
ncbi:YqhA family protein, partial [Acinetobacter baumannii]